METYVKSDPRFSDSRESTDGAHGDWELEEIPGYASGTFEPLAVDEAGLNSAAHKRLISFEGEISPGRRG